MSSPLYCAAAGTQNIASTSDAIKRRFISRAPESELNERRCFYAKQGIKSRVTPSVRGGHLKAMRAIYFAYYNFGIDILEESTIRGAIPSLRSRRKHKAWGGAAAEPQESRI